MSDKEYAHQALSVLEQIDVDTLDQDARDAHEQAVDTVDDLAVALGEDDETDDEEVWGEKVDEAYEAAEIPRSKRTPTMNTINDREYYYLQWREGEKVKSQYIAPVSPA